MIQVTYKKDMLPWQEQGLSYTASGFGGKIPTVYKVFYDGRWYRLYSAVYGNTAWLYIVVRGVERTVDIVGDIAYIEEETK